MTLDLFFGSCRVAVHAEPGILARLKRDFSWFTEERAFPARLISINCLQEVPEWSGIRGRYFFSHFDGQVYGWGDRRWVRYSDSLVHWDAEAHRGCVVSADEERVYHYAYYLVIAVVGQELDELGFHRFHSLAVAVDGRTALFSMPVSGGKTTLGLKLMEDPAVTLYSEDTPLIDSRGAVHAFAVRLSLREGYSAEIPERFLRVKNDPVFGRKILVDLEYHGLGRVEAVPGRNALIFWSVKSNGAQPRLEALPWWRHLSLLLYYVVVGKDCPQRAEVCLRLSPGGFRMLTTLLVRRTLGAWGLWRRSRSYRFYMSRDIEANAEFIKQFVREHRG